MRIPTAIVLTSITVVLFFCINVVAAIDKLRKAFGVNGFGGGFTLFFFFSLAWVIGEKMVCNWGCCVRPSYPDALGVSLTANQGLRPRDEISTEFDLFPSGSSFHR